MKRLFTALTVAFALCTCVCAYAQQKDIPLSECDWARFSRYEKENAALLASGVRPDAVFMGNSITQNWAKYHPDFFKNNNFVGRGISGQTTSHMLVRFRRDVLDLNPRVVVIMAGINDIARNNGIISLENIFGNIVSMCELAKLHNIKVVLCSLTPAVSFRWRKELAPADDIIRLNAMIKRYAVESGIEYVDYHSALVDERKGMNTKYHNDEVHPNSLCYAEVLEPMVLNAINKTLKTKHTYTTTIPKN
ncbi:MAG: acylhydrolase [Alistipes sp.]|nr:acylhydrolase [Alistipes sp.]